MRSGNPLSRELVITNKLGLHARSAAKIASIVRKARAPVWIENNDTCADASSTLDLLTLEAVKGSKIRLKIEDHADIDILEAVSQLIESGFGE